MAYIGRQNLGGAYRQLDDISSGFDGSDTTHTMQVNSTNVTVGDVNQIILSLGGVIQKPGTDFTVSGSTLTFTTAPAANTSFFAMLLGSDNGGTVTPTDGSVTTDKFASGVAIGATGTANTLAGIPFFSDTTNGSIYTHDVSGTDSTAQYNAAYGLQALDAITTADHCTAVGYQAGSAVTEGTGSTFVGYQAGLNNTTAQDNVAVGKTAGYGFTTGGRNIAVGFGAIYNADEETNNVAIGYASLSGSVAGGEYNVAVGNTTLDALTSGDNNVAVGHNAGTNVTTGVQNTFCGDAAGAIVTEGSGNVCVGKDTGNAGSTPLTTGDNNVFVGNAVAGTDATHSNAIGIGHNFTVVGDRFSFGKQSNVVTNSFTSDANFSRSSDERLKTNITDVNWKALDFINELRPVTFNWRDSKDVPIDMEEYDANTNHMDTTTVIDGLIAQEVKTAIDTHGITNFSGWKTDHKGTQTLSKEAFVIPLIKAVQELAAKVKALEEA